MMRLALLVVSALALSGAPCAAQNQSAARPLWGTLTPGPYPVGFRVLYRMDRSRVWETGDSILDADPWRPVRVSVWYPARADGSGHQMQYADYVHFIAPSGKFARLDALLETRDTISLRAAFQGLPRERAQLDLLPVVARREARAHSGKFPLVLYSAGWNSSSQHDNSVLAEYLASHGYVVAAVPQVGPSAQSLGLRVVPEDLEIQMRDIEFAMGTALELPDVARNSLALMGWSMGGVVSLFIEGRNPNVDAVVGLDPSFRFASWISLVTRSPYFAIRRLRAPLLALQSGHPQSVSGQSEVVLDSLHFAPTYVARVPNIVHGDFSDFPMIASRYPVRIVGRTAAQAVLGHEGIVRTVTTFLDGVLKNDSLAIAALLRDTSRANLQFRPPVVVPTEEEFVATLASEGLDRAVARYRALKARYPQLSIVDYPALNRLGYQLISEGKPDLAIGVFRLAAEAYPSTIDVFDSLADAYLAKSDSVGAKGAYERMLELLPTDTSLSVTRQREYRERAENFLRLRRPQQTTAFVDVNVLPMDRDSVLARQDVVVVDGKIAAIGPTKSLRIPAGAVRIPGGGTAFLIPGLVDAHVHLEFDERRWLPVFLAYGVTTVFNLRGRESHLDLRRAIASGSVVGPSVYTSGPYVNLPRIATAEDARRAVEEHRQLGFDFIKIHGDLAPDVYRTLAAEAKKAGIPVIGHAPRNLPFDSVVAMRQAMVAHAEELIYTHFRVPGDTSGIGRLGERMRKADIWLTPNLSAFSLIVTQIGRPAVIDSFERTAPPAFLSTPIDSFWRSGMYTARPGTSAPDYQRALTFLVEITGALHRSRVRMLAGTDTPLPGLAPGQALLLELRMLRDAGLGPFAALQTATMRAGEFISERLSPGTRIGVVRVGALADLVLVPRNPLEDLATLERPSGVMARGRWYDRATLDGFAGRK